MREVKTEKFSGPLDLLLRLIEEQQMDISQVSLATVTDQYLSELQKLEELPVDELADFLVVAAKLIYIKSRLMLPQAAAEEEDIGSDLERQLRMYKIFVDAAKTVNQMWNKQRVSYPREGFGPIEPIFNPPEGMKADHLREIMVDILKDLEPITRLPQTVLIRTINIRETIAKIRDQLINEKKASFHELISKAKSKTEAIVTFLAVLELVKQQTVTIKQEELHADMHIEIIKEKAQAELTSTTNI